MSGVCHGIILTTILTATLVPGTLHAEVLRRDGPLLTVRATGSATLGEGSKAQVHAKAKSLAIRKAIEEHAGVVITAQSTLRNFELTEDVVSSFARVYLKSIREIAYRYDSATETGVYVAELVIDTSSLERLSQAREQRMASRNKPVEAGVFLFDGEGRMIGDGDLVREGRQFNVMVQPSVDLHAYIVNRDSSGNLFRIFPNPDVSGHSNPLRRDRDYFFPPRESEMIFAFDGIPGTEHFYFLLSAAPLDDLDALFARLDALNGEQEKRDMIPIIQERIASRGIQLQSKSTESAIVLKNGGRVKMEKRVGEWLQGSGAFAKVITLRHLD